MNNAEIYFLSNMCDKRQVKNVFKLRISVSGICNYRCVFCHNEGRRNFSKEYMSLKNVLRLCKGAYLAGIHTFTFTGGEPLTHPNAFELIEEVRERYPDVILKLTTNAVLLKNEDIDFLSKNIDRIRINFQSMDSGVLERIVGIDRLDYLLELIYRLKKTKIHICLNYVYTTQSKGQLLRVIQYAVNQGLEIKVLELIRNSENEMYYEPIENAKKYLESIANNKEKDYQDDDLYFVSKTGPKIRLCYAHCNTLNGSSCRKLGELRVSPRMDVYPCMQLGTPRLRILKEDPPDKICESILQMDERKGICPGWSHEKTK